MDPVSGVVLALATFAIACISVIAQLWGELRQGRRDAAAQRTDLVDQTRQRERTEKLLETLQAESLRAFSESERRAKKIAQDALADADRRQRATERQTAGVMALEVRRRLYNEYALSHDGLTAGVLSGTDPLPDDWVHGKLAEWGLPAGENPTRRPWWRIG